MWPARLTEGYSANLSTPGYSTNQVARRPGQIMTADQRANNAHNGSVLREIELLAGNLGLRAVLTPRQLNALNKDAETWTTPVLDTILQLVKTVVHESLPGVQNAAAEHFIQEARAWMMDEEVAKELHPLGAGDVQEAVKRCQVEYADKKVAEGQQMMREYHLLEAHKKAIQDTLEIFKKSITDCSSNFEEVWHDIEFEVNMRHGILTHDLRQWLQEQFYELWEQARPLPPRKYTFRSLNPMMRAKGPRAKLKVTWEIPPGGTYDKSTGRITYESRHSFEEVYGIDGATKRTGNHDTQPIEIEHLSTKVVKVRLNGNPGVMA
ncbi:unnamed protein product [Zymoseptoria tritici ST99CH_1E4]|uniref:Uncharacterized protein n=1 Tax=Zymoseptoria tritici ST99CH_1E4 TaxID=1276532 RepID=A0A2H1H455_ZYMTR|nr:unnamed protein product [Zymoseptoria tritici ST99CH_1E4]